MLRPARPGELLVYVGTYTSGKSEGIYLYKLNLSSGELSYVATTRDVKDPSYLSPAPNRRYLYAVNELEEFAGQKVAPSAPLRLINVPAIYGC